MLCLNSVHHAEWKVVNAELVEVVNYTTSYNCHLHTIKNGPHDIMDMHVCMCAYALCIHVHAAK